MRQQALIPDRKSSYGGGGGLAANNSAAPPPTHTHACVFGRSPQTRQKTRDYRLPRNPQIDTVLIAEGPQLVFTSQPPFFFSCLFFFFFTVWLALGEAD